MSATAPEANGDDSRGTPPGTGEANALRMTRLLRALLILAGAAGSALLVLATRSTIIQIDIGAASNTASGLDTMLSGADRHGPALIVIAGFAVTMLVGAAQGARPAMLAVATAGILGLGISIISDATHIDDTGQLSELYTGAIAGAGNGFYFETLGGALLLICGGGLLVLSGGEPREPQRRAGRYQRRYQR